MSMETQTDTKFCVTGKRKHKSNLAAENQLQNMMEDNSIPVQSKQMLGVYFCDLCNTFHVGRSEKNK